MMLAMPVQGPHLENDRLPGALSGFAYEAYRAPMPGPQPRAIKSDRLGARRPGHPCSAQTCQEFAAHSSGGEPPPQGRVCRGSILAASDTRVAVAFSPSLSSCP